MSRRPGGAPPPVVLCCMYVMQATNQQRPHLVLPLLQPSPSAAVPVAAFTSRLSLPASSLLAPACSFLGMGTPGPRNFTAGCPGGLLVSGFAVSCGQLRSAGAAGRQQGGSRCLPVKGAAGPACLQVSDPLQPSACHSRPCLLASDGHRHRGWSRAGDRHAVPVR